ncbi:MAG: DUF6785 family protein, partial [Phycisphaerales bacterium]|nr:hypothetical protein [Anaerolinea sp.]MDW8262971.1 DUF6785 family protein [Phycisphaerales bacterium]
YFPRIPLGYDFTAILTEEPFYSLRPQVKKATLSFMILGLTYFIRSRAAFSLWGGYLLVNIISVNMRLADRDIPYAAWGDQHLGACIAFVLGIFWIGRQHWWRIVRNAFGAGSETTYRLTFWIAVGGTTVMFLWLLVVGVQAWMAGLIIAFILMAHLVVARVVAESGLPFYRADIAASQIYSQLPISSLTGRDVYFAGVFNALGPLTSRDSVLTFATTGLGICGGAELAARERRRLGLVITWALAAGLVMSAVATLYCQYSYPTPMMADSRPPRNYFGAERIPDRELRQPVVNFVQGRFEQKTHSVPLHIGIGFAVTALLEVASLRWASWPLLPIGYVASHGAFIANSWFSIFVGWIAKVLIVRFGGARLFETLRPLFVGMIFGEALAAGVWLLINALVVISGGESQPIRFLP